MFQADRATKVAAGKLYDATLDIALSLINDGNLPYLSHGAWIGWISLRLSYRCLTGMCLTHSARFVSFTFSVSTLAKARVQSIQSA
jgi:hypothetical protein